jgi:uncharacterized protein YndB with AHSA1/START domain
MSQPLPPFSLSLTRLLKAPRANIWQAFSTAENLAQWWCPKPWTTEVREFDFKAGGGFYTFLRGPDGGTSDNPGCFLAVEPMARIVSTSMLLGGFRPAPPSWMPMTAIWTFADEAAGTRYTATALHADQAKCDEHAKMGFEAGWGACAAQLEAFALGLR